MQVRFAELILDVATHELRRGDQALDVQPKAIALLEFLIERRERVVPKQELLDGLWPGQYVSDGVLKRAVHALRSAVGDSGARQSVVKTLSRRGYRFVAEVAPAAPPAGEAAANPDAATLREIPEPALPSPLESAAVASTPSARALVGRALPLGELRSAWARARAGRGAVVLIAGPPGIGKTRLVDELASRAAVEGGRVVTGFCDESQGTPPYWPWHRLVRTIGGVAARELTALDARVDEASSADGFREHADRAIFARLDGLARSLLEASSLRPLLIVLEDLHWADRATLSALAFVSREISDAPILIAGTFRDDALPPDHPLVQDLRRLTPRDSDLRIHLEGLSIGAVGELLAGLVGSAASEAATQAIHTRTDGNPLFVHEIARWLMTRGSLEDAASSRDWLDEVPVGVVGIIERRLAQLPSDWRSLVEVASVVGARFDLHLLAEVARQPIGEVADALAGAKLQGIVRPVNGGSDEWTFAHALLRETLLQALPPSRHLELQRAVLAALEARTGPDPGDALTRLAEHAHAIRRAGGEIGRALAYDRLAAWQAAARHAYADCAVHSERALSALRALESRSEVDLALSIETRIERARAAGMARDFGLAVACAEDAAELAAKADDHEALARAALTVYVHPPADVDLIRRGVRLLERAEACAPAGGLTAIRLVSARVEQLQHIPDSGERRGRDSRRALEWARVLDDRDALVCAQAADLKSNWSRYRPATRYALSRELCEAVESRPERFGDTAGLLTSLVEQGRFEEWEALLREMQRRIARASTRKYYAYYEPLYAATRALWRGECARAELSMHQALKASERAGPLFSARAFATQLFQLRIDQGRAGELEAAIRAAHAEFATDYTYPVVLAYVLAEQGRLEEARPIFEATVDDYQPEWDINATVTLTVMGAVCSALGDERRAERLYGHLLPWRDILAVNVGCYLCQGSLQWPLGLLARTAGRRMDAERHLEQAVERNRALGIRTYAARAGVDLAELLADRDDPRERARAGAVVESALELAHAVGMPHVIARGESLKARVFG